MIRSAAQINRAVQRADQAARREAQVPPDTVQRGQPVRHTSAAGARLAYCKNDAGSGTEIECYLDEDWNGVGEEPSTVTVICSVCNGSNLNEASPRLQDGVWIPVFQAGGNWYCNTVFETVEECDCYEA
ncbi:MAG TPA: hypothetical protein HPP51_05520 [Planctomycetes bacterium]|nr:hypothetical protein [Planctomycetota bacterium]